MTIEESKYGVTKNGKPSLCEDCAYVGYCTKHARFYRCKDYVKEKS